MNTVDEPRAPLHSHSKEPRGLVSHAGMTPDVLRGGQRPPSAGGGDGETPSAAVGPTAGRGPGAAFPLHAIESSRLTLYTGMSQAAVFFFFLFSMLGHKKRP